MELSTTRLPRRLVTSTCRWRSSSSCCCSPSTGWRSPPSNRTTSSPTTTTTARSGWSGRRSSTSSTSSRDLLSGVALEHDAGLGRLDLHALAASVFAAYAIERVRFTGARSTGLLIFLAYLVPPSILFIPLAFIVFKVGIFDSPLGADPDLPDLPHPLLHLAADGLLPLDPLRARGERAGRRRLALADPDQDDPAARGARPDLRRHLRLHPLLERVHLRADLHLLLGEQDRAGRRADRARRAATSTTGAR